MTLLRVCLTGLYCAISVFGVYAVAIGHVSPFASVFIVAYLCMAAALNQKGGSVVKWVAYGMSVIFIIFGILSLALFVSTFFGQEDDNLVYYVLAMFGLLGVSTLMSLRSLPKTAQIPSPKEPY